MASAVMEAGDTLAMPWDEDNQDNISEIDEAEDVRLMEHNQRFQAAVLATMEKTLSAMEDEVLKRDATIEMQARSREDLGLALSQVNREIRNLRKSLEKSNAELAKAKTDRRTALVEKQRAEGDCTKLDKELKVKQQEISGLQVELRVAKEELENRSKVQAVFSNDLVVHRKLKENLEQELANSQKEAKRFQTECETLRKRVEEEAAKALAQKALVDDQEAETKRAQTVVEKLTTELQLLKSAKDVISRQWEQAVTAMKKRDAAIKSAKEVSSEAMENAQVLKTQEWQLLQENSALVSRITSLEEEVTEWREANDRLNEGALVLKDQKRKLEAALEEKSVELARTASDLSKATAGKKQAQGEVERIRGRQSALTAELEELKNRYGRLEADADMQTRSATSTIETMKAEFDKNMKGANHLLLKLDNDRQGEKYRTINLQNLLKDLQIKHALLDGEFKSLLGQFNKISRENQHLEQELEVMTYKANKAQQLYQDLKREKQKDLEDEEGEVAMTIRDLEAKVEMKKSEYDDLSKLYLRTQEDVLKAQKRLESINQESRNLKEENAIVNQTNLSLKARLKSTEKEGVDRDHEMIDVKLDLRRSIKQVATLKEENEDLKKKLADASFLAQARQAEHEAELGALKVQAKKIAQKNDAIELLRASEKEKNALARKYEHLTMKYENQKKEVIRYSKEAFDLRLQLQSSHKDTAQKEREYQKWQKQFEVVFSKELKERQARLLSKQRAEQVVHSMQSMGGEGLMMATAPAGLSALASPRTDKLRKSAGDVSLGAMDKGGRRLGGSRTARVAGAAGAKANTFVENLVHELRKQLHRASTVSAERLNEIIRLKTKLKASVSEEEKSESLENELKVMARQLKGEQRILRHDLVLAQNKYLRAEAVAASMEKQLLKLISAVQLNNRNVSKYEGLLTIEYRYDPDVEPSELLRAAIDEAVVGMVANNELLIKETASLSSSCSHGSSLRGLQSSLGSLGGLVDGGLVGGSGKAKLREGVVDRLAKQQSMEEFLQDLDATLV